MNNHPKLCIAGKNEIAVFGLHFLAKKLGRENICVCLNINEEPYPSWQPSLRRHASQLDIKIIKLEELYDKGDLIFVSLEFDRIISPSKFNSNQLYNIHFSMLPKYKGMYTSCWPILNGEKNSGVTLHRIDQGIDTGNIIAQHQINILEKMTSRDLYLNYLEEGKNLLEKNIDAILSGTFSEKKQPAKNSSYFSKKSINFSSLSIDCNQTAENICNQVRAYTFKEYQLAMIGSHKVSNGRILLNRSSQKAGEYNIKNEHLILSTIDYDVEFSIDRSMEIFDLIKINDVEKIPPLSKADTFDVNITNKDGWSPLMIAAFNGNLDLCRILISLGANINQPNCNGTTPLMYALSSNVSENKFLIAKLLIENGALLGVVDMFGLAAIDYARKNGDDDVINFIKEFK
jgi:methionyl-tRNA formyltransferase